MACHNSWKIQYMIKHAGVISWNKVSTQTLVYKIKYLKIYTHPISGEPHADLWAKLSLSERSSPGDLNTAPPALRTKVQISSLLQERIYHLTVFLAAKQINKIKGNHQFKR